MTELPHNPVTHDSTLWYVIQTKPASEHRVEVHLSGQEIAAYLPMLETFHYLKGKMIPKIKPLFPSYLFARLDICAAYYRVKWTRGVNKILGIGGEPIPISELVIQTLRQRTGENNVVRLDDELEKGSIVQFTSGPFKDLTGVFDKRISDGGRVRILLSLIGVDVPVQVSRHQIRKVA
ncbi:MAG TPA: transcription termination/antitermination NusG family protein [Thermodesulfobacteriota bacterium]|nr:transcription termination/antitermination NusG family protein [Thermodesulfobacteriota bacterium]